jgi:hypothetical protein
MEMDKNEYTDGDIVQLEVTIPPNVDDPLDSMDNAIHELLLQYLKARLDQGNIGRSRRLWRYARIDKLISTYQKLNVADSAREDTEDLTGRTQALPMNLPLLASHLEDTVAFFAEIFAPIGGAFHLDEGSDSAKKLVDKLNRDASARSHYAQICWAMRSLIKYNVGGFHITWEEADDVTFGLDQPGNRWNGIDIYNFLYDPAITDVERISTEGEWAAVIEQKNRLWLIKKALTGTFSRVDRVIEQYDNNAKKAFGQNSIQKNKVKYFRPPPAEAGLPSDGRDDHTSAGESPNSTVNWSAYGAGLANEMEAEITGHEIVTMYCWICPDEWKLIPDQDVKRLQGEGINPDSYIELWKFVLADGNQIVQAKPLTPRGEAKNSGVTAQQTMISGGEIPIHIAHLTVDDMRQAQRSIMEYMRGFQRFASYMLNLYIAGMRKNIWGLKGVDSSMFDPAMISEGDVAGVLLSKVPGRDVRTGLISLDSTSGVDGALSSVQNMLELFKQFFPAQALPQQIASIDRAVKDQVSAVMQGSQRRMHMLIRALDASLHMPARLTSFKNLRRYDGDGISDMNTEDAAKVLGSGLESINADRIITSLTSLIFAILQNKEASAQYDVAGLFKYLSRLMNLGVDLGTFVKNQAPAQGAPPVPGTDAAAAAGATGVDASGGPAGSVGSDFTRLINGLGSAANTVTG